MEAKSRALNQTIIFLIPAGSELYNSEAPIRVLAEARAVVEQVLV